jgi:hypothetical protein
LNELAGAAFLAGMPPAVARQRDILSGMLTVAELEPVLRWLELGCSLARGAGDELSDIDCGVGVADDSFDDALALSDRLAAVGGDIRDQMRQVFPGRADRTCWHVHTLYSDGAQLSVVLMPASWRNGRPPGSIALYDADRRLAEPFRPAVADTSADTAREWAYLAWIALGDLVKYLHRGSVWEAYQRLHDARGHVWQLWNVAHQVPFATYGLTALLDEPVVTMPPDVDATVATLDADDIRRAARVLARTLDEVVTAAVPDPPNGFRDWVLELLV